ncbi:MAG TPA: DUF4159 domain-containing protein [Opitutales bacterium]|nr:DUF4159 domain-containing protein [Opitutales bacterium]
MRKTFQSPWMGAVLAGLFGLLLLASPAQAQPFGGPGGGGRRGGGRGGFGGGRGGRSYGANGEDPGPSFIYETNGPQWTNDPAFKDDVFTFARLIYPSPGYGYNGGGEWWTDTPDADLNLTFRLHQLTSLKVRPGLNYIRITPDNLAKYPFVYIVEPGRLQFTDAQVTALRQYLLNGGFLMVDDFWGSGQWRNLYEQIKRVLPEYEPVELGLDHPIFHTVFDLKAKPQMPGIEVFMRTGLTWEQNWDYNYESHDSHFFGIFDHKDHMMVFISHNNDFGDGWEREGVSEEYFHRFSEPQAYPMIINVLFYTMTH